VAKQWLPWKTKSQVTCQRTTAIHPLSSAMTLRPEAEPPSASGRLFNLVQAVGMRQ
jgi:hypothetical protein